MDEQFRGHMAASVVVGIGIYFASNETAGALVVVAALLIAVVLLQMSLANWADKRAAYRILRGLYAETDTSLKPLLEKAIESEGIILQEILREPEDDLHSVD